MNYRGLSLFLKPYPILNLNIVEFIKIKARKFLPPQDDLYELLDGLPKLKNEDILVLTSKVVSIHQGRCIKKNKGDKKEKLAVKEAEYILSDKSLFEGKTLTIAGSTLSYSAGIDESNGNGYYVLRPLNLEKTAKEIWQYLKKKNKINKLGILIIDSISEPLRCGAIGKTIGFFGLKPVKYYKGQPDIFGRRMKCERTNQLDPIASLAMSLMGEAGERVPMVIARGVPFVEFTDRQAQKEFFPSMEKDIYKILFRGFIKNKKVK